MKAILNLIAAASLLAAASFAQPANYTFTDLGPPGTPFSAPAFINNHGLITGSGLAPDFSSHAVLWYNGVATDISQAGYGGINSGAGPVNNSGQVVVGAETASFDPNNENFCAFFTNSQCIVFMWQNGAITPLPTLGGTNSNWGAMNNRGEIAGWAETGTKDPDCLSTPMPNGVGPQVLYFEAVVWGPLPGQIRQLAPLPGDSVSLAAGINDNGQAVGLSGQCSNTELPPYLAGPHAVFWDADGSVHDLGSFGGTFNPSILAVGNAALAINNDGQVVGTSAVADNSANQPFIWSEATGILHLPLLAADVVGAGLDINNSGEAVGVSISTGGAASGFPKAVLWPNGASGGVTDLNSLLTPDSPFVALFTAFVINDGGEIVGIGLTAGGEVHAFLATPTTNAAASSGAKVTPPANLPAPVRKLLFGRR